MNNRNHDRSRCLKINAIRDAARASLGATEPRTACPTCGRAAHAPHFRADSRGHGVEGCVDAFHATAHHVGGYAQWFARPAAQAIRADVLAALSR